MYIIISVIISEMSAALYKKQIISFDGTIIKLFHPIKIGLNYEKNGMLFRMCTLS